MADIIDINEAWAGHSGLEVERFVKNQMTRILAASEGKFGATAFNPQTMTITFYDQPGGTPLGNIQLGGDIYTITPNCNLPQIFYILADESSKMMTIAPTTSKSSFGSSESQPFPEGYSYVVAVNTGSGYIDRIGPEVIQPNGSATFDIKPFLATGDNYIRIAITGLTSGQTTTVVFTGTLTTLSLSCNHSWQNVWNEGLDYNITGIRFAGNLWKTLEVTLDDVPLPSVEYSPTQSYTTTATYYTIPASAFPQVAAQRGLRSGGNQSGVHSVKLKMTAQGVSTPEISFNIMCVAEGDNRPLVAINAVAAKAYNFTNGTIFSYAVYNADKVSIDLSATLNSIIYPIASGVEATNREAGMQYAFAYSLEVDTGSNNTQLGSLAIAAKAYNGSTEGNTATAGTIFDNTFSYLAAPGYVFYLNAATRDNSTADRQTIINEAGGSEDFPATYPATWNGLSWYNDGWARDSKGYKALCIPAGCSLSVPTLTPLEFLTHQGYDGMTVEMMLQCASPSEYSQPVFSFSTGGETPKGIIVYPTKIVVYTNAERNEDVQCVNFSENAMTHICVTILRNYEGESGKNICSVYINGIANVSFSFTNASTFGDGGLHIGQENTDAYLYKMRVYPFALEPRAVFSNLLNCIIDGVEFSRSDLNAKNNILLGSKVDYDLVQRAGFNIMVVTTPVDEVTGENIPIPNIDNNYTVKNCTVRFEYAGFPTKKVTVANVDMDGQGTTSKQYFRWNLRWKTSDNTTWTYGDGTTGQGKSGRMINDTNYIIVDRITAKKNIASSPQGHKMGLTGLYNDLFHQLGLGEELPEEDYLVAVYQFPFFGFQYNSVNNTYEFIGIYTCGPDKGSKVSFGYLKNQYPNCLSIEGPNHNPAGTRFLCPWVDVTYDQSQETLCFGGDEGWDVDYVKWESSTKGTQTDWDNILALYNSEWRPAYNCVYDNSPYIASDAEVIAALNNPNINSLSDLLDMSKAASIIGGTTNNMEVSNEYIAFYVSEATTIGGVSYAKYDLCFYRRKFLRYEKLPNDYTGYKNALDGLTSYLSDLGYSTTAPTTAQIIAARAARFKATMTDYFSKNQALFHYCFCILYGVTDNFAKNSYPFKFRGFSETLPSGANINQKRWGWRQDDLDTVLMTDNTGKNTKKYSVEHGDTFLDAPVFQGGNSAFWVLIRDNYAEECAEMMALISSRATALATALGIAGNGEHESLFNLTSYYCWEHSAKYFPATAYEEDRRWSYIGPWLLAGKVRPNGQIYPDVYNGVAPLQQALGDQYQGEKLWMERRIAYIFSKYKVAGFSGDKQGFGRLDFTLAKPFYFYVTPAIDLYPVISIGSTDKQAGRTAAGQSAELYLTTDGQTTNYLHGLSWLASLGDLSGMKLNTRGTSTTIDFLVTAERLQSLKIGDADPSNLEDGFNASNFAVTSPTLVTLDAQNTATIRNIVNLLKCPRLRVCLFAGSGATGLYLPIGAKLTQVSFPDNAEAIFMHSLPFLQPSGLTWPDLSKITQLYINNCENINPLTVVANIMATAGERLAYVTLIWSGIIETTAPTLVALAAKSGEMVFDGNDVTPLAGKPRVEGMAQIPGMYADDLDTLDIISWEQYGTGLRKALSGLFGTNLYIIYNPSAVGIRFADANVEAICIAHWDTDGNGVLSTTEAATPTSLSTYFRGNTEITEFNELKYFTGLGSIYGASSGGGAFNGCTALTKIYIPRNVLSIGVSAFTGCTALAEITFENTVGAINFETSSFTTGASNIRRVNISSVYYWCLNTSNNRGDHMMYNTPSGVQMYLNGVLLENMDLSVYQMSVIRKCNFMHVTSLRTVTLASPTRSSGNFSIEREAFMGCTNLRSITIPSNLSSIGQDAFNGCSQLNQEIVLPSAFTSGASGMFASCSRIIKLVIPTAASSTWMHGAGTGILDSSRSILQVAGAYTCSGQNNGNVGFCRQYFNGGLSWDSTYAFTGIQMMHVKVTGNLSYRPTVGGFRYSANWYSRFILLEVSGTLTRYSSSGTNTIIGTNWWNSSTYGFMLHLSYEGVACIPGILPANKANVSKIYVGDGSSAEHDNAILQQYMESADWSGNTSKLDTWYNYLNSGWTLEDQIAMGLKQGFVAINRALTSTVANTFAFATVNGLCVTDLITLTNGHSYTYYVGDVPSSYKRVIVTQAGAQRATTGITATTFTAGSSDYGMRLTVSMAAIQNRQAYVYDNTTGKYVWPNSFDFTPNSHD